MGPRSRGASNFMKASKLSIPRRPVEGSGASSGSGRRSQNSSNAGSNPVATSLGNNALVIPISFTYASAPKASKVACCAFQPKRPTRSRPVPTSVMTAARPLMPSLSRSSGSSRDRNVSSGMASINPAPNSGTGIRREMTFASAGILGWQNGWEAKTGETEYRRQARGKRPPRRDNRREPPKQD